MRSNARLLPRCRFRCNAKLYHQFVYCRRYMERSIPLLVRWGLLIVVTIAVEGLVFETPSGIEKCVSETVNAGVQMVADFQSLNSDITFNVRLDNPRKVEELALEDESRGHLEVTSSEAGDYRLCFKHFSGTCNGAVCTMLVVLSWAWFTQCSNFIVSFALQR